MTAGPTRRRASRVRQGLIAVIAVVVISVGGALMLAQPEGLVHDLLDWAEPHVPDDMLYGAHSFLGAAFGLCPCTADLSSSQYEKASFHRPPSPTANPH